MRERGSAFSEASTPHILMTGVAVGRVLARQTIAQARTHRHPPLQRTRSTCMLHQLGLSRGVPSDRLGRFEARCQTASSIRVGGAAPYQFVDIS